MNNYQKLLIALLVLAASAFSLPYILLNDKPTPTAASAVIVQGSSSSATQSSSSMPVPVQTTKPGVSQIINETTTSQVTYTPSQSAASNSTSSYSNTTRSTETKSNNNSTLPDGVLSVNIEVVGADIFNYSGSIEISAGDTAYEATSKYLKANGISFKSTSGSLAYVSSINNLKEKQYGAMSGWMYSVDGAEPGVGCGQYKLNGGENIAWTYNKDE